MKVFQKFLIGILVLVLVLVPIFAIEIPVENFDGVASEGDITIIGDPNASNADLFAFAIEDLTVNPERVLDYDKMYHLAYVTINDCASVNWYIFNADGTTYNSGSTVIHHGQTIEIKWNSLDLYGHHPAGRWNRPTTRTFYLTVVAVDSHGYGLTRTEMFNYSWYDNDRPSSGLYQNVQPVAPGTRPRVDVPHTGL